MKRKYIIPEMKLIELESNILLTGSNIRGGDDGEEGDRAECKESVFDQEMDRMYKSLWDIKW